MGLRILLVVSGLVAILLGGFFLLSPDAAIAGFQLGESSVPARLFVRLAGVLFILVGLLNLAATRDVGSPALTAILAFNLLLHIGSPLVDLTESFPKTGGYWVALALHVVFAVGFAYYLFAGSGQQRKAAVA